ncbi:MAG: ATP-binding protein [Pseudomonadota bacterium]
MNLALRLNLMVALALLLLLGGAVSLILSQARESVAEETDSALTLTLQLLEALSGAGTDLGEDVTNAALPSDDAVVSALIARVSRLRDVRHVDIGLVRSDGMQPFIPSDLGAEGSAPRWFARLVEPEPVEYRYQLALQGRRVGIALRPRPGDEIDEAWQESLATFALLVSFALLVMLLTGWISHRALRPVDKVLRALDRLEQGDYSTRVQRFDLPELQRISDRLNHVAATLSAQAQENRALSRQALAIQEAERRHLAQELHDELGQAISAIKALAVSARQRAGDAPAVTERTSTICDVSDQMYAVVRRLMSELRPATLDDLGLHASLEKLVDDWRDRHHGVLTQLSIEGDLADLHEDTTIKIYRIVQEALTNVARHAKASKVEVQVTLDDQLLTVDVRDDGVGIAPATLRKGLGLVGMRERIESLGGALTLDRLDDQGGTLIVARIPQAHALADVPDQYSPQTENATPA